MEINHFYFTFFVCLLRQIALKALSERLSKSHALDKLPLIPKANKVVMPPSLTHGTVPSTSTTPQTTAVSVPVSVTPSQTTFTSIQPNQ